MARVKIGLDLVRSDCSYCSQSYFSYCAVTAGELTVTDDKLFVVRQNEKAVSLS